MKRASSEGGKKREDKRGWKRSKQAPPPAPAFTDVTASVSAAQFTARRLPELKQLYVQRKFVASTLLDTIGFQSGGGRTSSRHLRRRATSFQRRQRHRYPHTQKVGVPPEPQQDKKEGNDDKDDPPSTPSRRKQRRNKAALIAKHSVWKRPVTTATDAEDTTSSPDSRLHWIPTHLWHAKRFRMHDLWGWQVPIMHTNRGIRAALRLVRERPVVQDVTWRAQPVVWCVPHVTAALRQALGRILADFDWSDLINSEIVAEHKKDDLLLYGECMLHGLDQNPMGAIAPVTYLVKHRALLSGQQEESGIFFYIWGHASVQNELWQLLKTVLVDVKEVRGLSCGMGGGGLACLQLRGKNTSQCLKQCFLAEDEHEKLKVSQKVSFTNFSESPIEGKLHYMRWPGSHPLVCIWTQPRDPSLPCNLGVCGMDIFAQPDSIRQLFLQLVLKGGACPIGLLEDAALRLEAQPPMPVFPRDFPDTAAGVAYWTPGDSRDWSILREYDYGSVGRIRNSPLSDRAVSWKNLVPGNADGIIMVRGAFLKPFFDAWNGLGKPQGGESQLAKEQKKRRKVLNPTILRKSPKPAAALVSAHESYCRSLAESLTLPAAVFCEICIDGPGVFAIGAPLYRWGGSSADKARLGYVCAGAFSPRRGCFHGTAVVGARALLEAISMAHTDGTALARRSSVLGERILLLIQVGEGSVRAGLTLLA